MLPDIVSVSDSFVITSQNAFEDSSIIPNTWRCALKYGKNETKIGISFNSDGTTSFFAELEKSSASQRERIERAQKERRTQRKEDTKKADREKQKECLEGKVDRDVKRTTVWTAWRNFWKKSK